MLIIVYVIFFFFFIDLRQVLLNVVLEYYCGFKVFSPLHYLFILYTSRRGTSMCVYIHIYKKI